MNMDPQERERYLQLGRKMLEEKLGNIRKTNVPTSASLPTVTEDYNYNYSPNSLPGTPTKLPVSINTDKYASANNTPLKTPSGGLYGSQNYLNSPYNIGAPQSPVLPTADSYEPTSYSSPVNNSIASGRDQNSQTRLNELTRERAELSAELFKQKKTCEELTNQNNQLRQRISNFEKIVNQNQQFEDKIASLESENARISELLKNEQNKSENVQESNEELKKIVQSLSSEKSLLEQQLLEKVNTFQLTHEESQDHQKQLEEKNQNLQNEILKLQENQRKVIEKSEEIQSKNEKLTGDLKEKEQQLSIIYQESQERQKVYQNTISLFNEKNQVIQQLNTQIEQLKNEVSTSLASRNQLQSQFDQFKLDAQVLTENKQQTIYQLQERIEMQEKRIKEIESEKSNSRAVQDIIDNKVSTMNQLQDKIQSQSNENEKLKQTIASYTEIMDNLQQTHAQIVETYEFKLREFSLRHQEENKAHLNLINQLQSQLLKFQSSPVPSPSLPAAASSLESIQSDLKLLHDVRETHKANKQNPNSPIEELQEIKIQELLEEISIMDGLLNKVPFVSAVAPSRSSPPELLERIEYLENELNSRSSSLTSAQQEVSALLLAIETGDLSAYSELKLQQHLQQQQAPPPDPLPQPGDSERCLEVPDTSNEDPVPELVSVEEPLKPSDHPNKPTPPTPSKKRFWFF